MTTASLGRYHFLRTARIPSCRSRHWFDQTRSLHPDSDGVLLSRASREAWQHISWWCRAWLSAPGGRRRAPGSTASSCFLHHCWSSSSPPSISLYVWLTDEYGLEFEWAEEGVLVEGVLYSRMGGVVLTRHWSTKETAIGARPSVHCPQSHQTDTILGPNPLSPLKTQTFFEYD